LKNTISVTNQGRKSNKTAIDHPHFLAFRMKSGLYDVVSLICAKCFSIGENRIYPCFRIVKYWAIIVLFIVMALKQILFSQTCVHAQNDEITTDSEAQYSHYNPIFNQPLSLPPGFDFKQNIDKKYLYPEDCLLKARFISERHSGIVCEASWAGKGADIWVVSEGETKGEWTKPFFTGLTFLNVKLDHEPYVFPLNYMNIPNGYYEQSMSSSVQGDTLTIDIPFLEKKYENKRVYKRTVHGKLEIDINELKKDSDGDGMTDLLEKRLGLDPYDSDTDHDGISDLHDTNPLASLKNNCTDAVFYSAIFKDLDIPTGRNCYDIVVAEFPDFSECSILNYDGLILTAKTKNAFYYEGYSHTIENYSDTILCHGGVSFERPAYLDDNTVSVTSIFYQGSFPHNMSTLYKHTFSKQDGTWVVADREETNLEVEWVPIKNIMEQQSQNDKSK
jgi:hypothetical protein